MPTSIYVIQCEGSRYYIGKTDRDVHVRFREHVAGDHAWTKLYKPERLVEVIEQLEDTDEDTVTKRYMFEYGIPKVRGGSYCSVKLPPSSILSLKQELCTAKNLCFKCMRSGHFAADCTVVIRCDRCGFFGHVADTCFARRRYSKGESIPLLPVVDRNMTDDDSSTSSSFGGCCCCWW